MVLKSTTMPNHFTIITTHNVDGHNFRYFALHTSLSLPLGVTSAPSVRMKTLWIYSVASIHRSKSQNDTFAPRLAPVLQTPNFFHTARVWSREKSRQHYLDSNSAGWDTCVKIFYQCIIYEYIVEALPFLQRQELRNRNDTKARTKVLSLPNLVETLWCLFTQGLKSQSNQVPHLSVSCVIVLIRVFGRRTQKERDLFWLERTQRKKYIYLASLVLLILRNFSL